MTTTTRTPQLLSGRDPAAPDTSWLSLRHCALLRAVAAERCLISGGRAPDMFIDDRCSCDQSAVRDLARAGLIAPMTSQTCSDERVAATLTPAGRAALDDRLPSQHLTGECATSTRNGASGSLVTV